jgi:hypothetical protein
MDCYLNLKQSFRKMRKLYTTHLPDRIVTSPNNVSVVHAGNPGAEVDQFSDSLFSHQDGFGWTTITVLAHSLIPILGFIF